MKPQRRKQENLLPVLGVIALWTIAGGLISAIVWSNLSENIKIMMGGGALSTIVGSLSTLLNVVKADAQHDAIGNQVNVTTKPKEDEKEI